MHTKEQIALVGRADEPGGETAGRGGVVKGGVARALRTSGTAVAAAATPGGSGGLAADIDALAASLGHPGRTAGVAVEVAAAAPGDVVETEASSWPGTAAGSDVEPDVQPDQAGATGASASGSTSRPTSPARTRSRRLQPARRPPGAEDLDGAREAPVAAGRPRCHQPT